MLNLTTQEVLTEVIIGMSSKINKKALRETIEEYSDCRDLNEVLFQYYQRVHRIEQSSYNLHDFQEINLEDPDDVEYLQSLGAKKYKKPYDYTRGYLQPVKQKNTGFGAELVFGWVSRWSWLFNVYKYLEVNNINIQD